MMNALVFVGLTFYRLIINLVLTGINILSCVFLDSSRFPIALKFFNLDSISFLDYRHNVS